MVVATKQIFNNRLQKFGVKKTIAQPGFVFPIWKCNKSLLFFFCYQKKDNKILITKWLLFF
jgi:hypothetical protein